MRILAYEHATGGGMLDDPRMPAWAAEGDAMLRALVDDLRLIPGVEVVVPRDPRLAGDIPGALPAPASASAFRPWLRSAILACDAVWPIAPESDDILLGVSNEVIDCGRGLLNSFPEAVRVSSSKAATHAVLEQNGIPSIACFSNEETLPSTVDAVVVKPDDGAGCLDTHLFRDRSELRRWLRHRANPRQVLQAYVAGEPCSLSMICSGGKARLLACNRQKVVIDGSCFRFDGVEVAALEDDGSYARLAARIGAALPGLWGYCGVDLIATPAGPVVVEINPRLTLSYVGLRRATGLNPAALVVDMAGARRFPADSVLVRASASGALNA